MTAREKQLVRESFYAIRDEAGALSLLFYGRLFELNPNVRKMFHGDIARQGLKLMQMLASVVDSLDRFDTLAPALQALGQRHIAYGVQPHHYQLVEQALLWSLGQALVVPAGSDVLLAWRQLLQEVSAGMLVGQVEATPTSASPGSQR